MSNIERKNNNSTNKSTSSQNSDISHQFHFIKSDDFKRSKTQIYPSSSKIKHLQVGSAGSNLVYDVSNESLQSNLGIYKWKYKCPTCHGNASVYYCAECIKKGNFCHSSVKYPERYADKRLRERQLRQEVVELGRKTQFDAPRRLRAEVLRREIEVLKERNGLIRKVIDEKKSKVCEVQALKLEKQRQIANLKKCLPKFKNRISTTKENISRYNENIPEKKERIFHLESEYEMRARERIREIACVVFPFSVIKTSEKEYENPIVAQMVKGIAEATQTHYVKGKWITVAYFNQHRNFRILSSVLPETGDYASFIRPHVGPEKSAKEEAENICAGLSFVCQLVNLIAFYLHVHLPKNLSFRDFSNFSKQEMVEKKFLRLVSRLNYNVFHLCLSQGLRINILHPFRPLPNLLALLSEKRYNLGSKMPRIEYPDSVLEDIELEKNEDFLDSDSDSEWETVNAEALPEFSVPPVPSSYRRTSIDETASGLVTSAAASVLSMFGIGNR